MNYTDYMENRLPVMNIIQQRISVKIPHADGSILVDLPDHWARAALVTALEGIFERVDVWDDVSTDPFAYDYVLEYDGSVLERIGKPLNAKGIIICGQDGHITLRNKQKFLHDDARISVLEDMELYHMFSSGFSSAQAFIDYYQNHAGILLAGKRIVITGIDDLSQSFLKFFFSFNASPSLYVENSIEKLRCCMLGWNPAQSSDIKEADFVFLGRGFTRSSVDNLLSQIRPDCVVVNVGGIEVEKMMGEFRSDMFYKEVLPFEEYHYVGASGERVFLFDGHDALRRSFSCFPPESVDMLYALILLTIEYMRTGKDILTEKLNEQIASIKLQTLSFRG